MRQRSARILKAILFAGILLICVGAAEKVLIPKYLTDNKWETTSRMTGFYQIKKNTVDVLGLGSSRAASAFDPQVLYDEYGIRAYNLGIEQQSMAMSYFWLKEALRYQNPKVVLVHTTFLFDTKRPVLNASEGCVRRALDWMRWSPVKWEAIHDICAQVPDQELISYLFPYYIYHSRWNELTDEDYDLSFLFAKNATAKGFVPLRTSSGNQKYAPYDASESDEVTESDPVMEEYLDKIIDLCQERGIEVLLYDTPCSTNLVSKHNYVAGYAERKGVLFLDYGERTLYDEIGYAYAEDNADRRHPNIWGAEKLAMHLGKVLRDVYQVPGVEDEQWTATQELYQDIRQDGELIRITDMKEYLEALQDDHYCIFLALQTNGRGEIEKDMLEALEALGMHCGFAQTPSDTSYLAVIDEGVLVDERLGAELLTGEGSVAGEQVIYQMTSGANGFGNTSSIMLNGIEYSLQQDGLNLVIYDPQMSKVVDQIVYNPNGGNRSLERRKIYY